MTTFVCDYCEKGLFSVPPIKTDNVSQCPYCGEPNVSKMED